MTSTSRCKTALVAVLALFAPVVAGCGKTDNGLAISRKDPRIGPIRAWHLPAQEPLPLAEPRWDPPTAANGFAPVPVVERHP